METFKPLRFLDEDGIPYLLQDTSTVSDIFGGLALCLDMVYQSVDRTDNVLAPAEVSKMARFCKAVCEMANDYHIDKIDNIYSRYAREGDK